MVVGLVKNKSTPESTLRHGYDALNDMDCGQRWSGNETYQLISLLLQQLLILSLESTGIVLRGVVLRQPVCVCVSACVL